MKNAVIRITGDTLKAWLSEVRADLVAAGYTANDADIAIVFQTEAANFCAIKAGRRLCSTTLVHNWIARWNLINVKGARRWMLVADDRGVRIVRRQTRM